MLKLNSFMASRWWPAMGQKWVMFFLDGFGQDRTEKISVNSSQETVLSSKDGKLRSSQLRIPFVQSVFLWDFIYMNHSWHLLSHPTHWDTPIISEYLEIARYRNVPWQVWQWLHVPNASRGSLLDFRVILNCSLWRLFFFTEFFHIDSSGNSPIMWHRCTNVILVSWDEIYWV
jgi:hypothetical protein